MLTALFGYAASALGSLSEQHGRAARHSSRGRKE